MIYTHVYNITWGVMARRLARWIDYYILCTLRKRYKIREIWARDVFKSHYQFDEMVEFGMLKEDTIHLNQYGNKALASAVMKAVLNKWKWAK